MYFEEFSVCFVLVYKGCLTAFLCYIGIFNCLHNVEFSWVTSFTEGIYISKYINYSQKVCVNKKYMYKPEDG